MKRKAFIQILCLILTAALFRGLFAGAGPTVASAATTSYNLCALLNEGKIKPLGRTQANAAGDGITANWSGNGFEINVDAAGGDLTVGYTTNVNSLYAAILVDGQQAWRGSLNGTGTIKTTLSAGRHTVSVIRETGHSSSTTAYLHFTTLAFDGTVEAAPAEKELYIEVIGDSYACGLGSAADYEPGVAWGDADHSVQASFGWYLSQMLDSDLSIVARGGIGLFDGTSEQEGTANTVTMHDIYPYASGHNQSEGLYSFARKPDLVIIELGANDGIVSSDQYKTADAWGAKLQEMVELVREKNGSDTKIVLLSHNSTKYYQMLKLADADENIWACHFSHHGNGAAALATQTAGHPNADDEYEIAEALYQCIENNGVFGASQPEPAYTDLVYYVSENGSDDNDGTSIDKATKTLKALFTKIQETHGTKFPSGTRIVIYVEGTVLTNSSASQVIDGGQVFLESGGSIRDHIPIVLTTYNYSGERAAIEVNYAPVDDGNASVRVVNDLEFKDIILTSAANTETGYASHRLYAAGCTLTFDNALLTTDGKATATTEDNTKWIVSADHFNASGFNPLKEEWLPLYGNIIFKNGDYTNLNYVTAVNVDSIPSGETALPGVHCRVVIEDGAQMGTVYGAYGTMGVGSVTVELCGGSVGNYFPTRSGTSSSALTYNTNIKTVFNGTVLSNPRFMGTGAYVNINGNVETEFRSGQYVGTLFAGVGNNSTVNGNVTNTISGGEIRIQPTSTVVGDDGLYLGGYKEVTVNGDLVNNISGGELNMIYDANVDSGIYLGLRGGSINGNMTNNISGGNIAVFNGAATPKSCGIYLGMYGGNISGTLTNHLTGGTLDATASSGGINFGDRTIGNKIGKIVNIIGTEGSLQGPRIIASVSLGGGWAYLGTDLGNRAPTADDCSDTVVLDTTIYGGWFSGAVYAGVNGASYTSGSGNTTYSYVSGSVKTEIYGGMFPGGFYGTSGAPVAGHVTTNIFGGCFTSIYGTRSAAVYDGVELNIYGMTEYYPINASNTYGIWAGGSTGKVSVKTKGLDAVKLTIAPENNEALFLNTPIYAGFSGDGSVTGTTTVSVSGGIYPSGFAVDGKTLGEVLADSCGVYDYISGSKMDCASTDTAVSGYVEILADGETTSRELTYYVRPNGDNSNDGTRFVSAKLTVAAAFAQAVADNGGSTVFPNGSRLTIYVDGTVNASSGQVLGYARLLTTADGGHMETVLTTYNYTDTKATVVHSHAPSNSSSASAYLGTDLTLKDIAVVSRKSSDGFTTNKLYAAGCALTFDNAELLTNSGVLWAVSADHFSNGGIDPTADDEMYGTVTFRNGDYTGLNYVATVNAGSIWVDGTNYYDFPNMHCKVIIEDGAKMGTVYGPAGEVTVGSSSVEVLGGSVSNLYGTGTGSTVQVDTCITVSGGTVDSLSGTGANATLTGDVNITVSGGTVGNFSGTGTAAKVTGNVNNTITGGTVGKERIVGVGNNAVITGNVTNTISDGKLIVCPTANTHGIYFGGGDTVTVTGNVTNNITGGEFGVIYDTAAVQSGIYFGTRSGGTIGGDLINNISGGSFYTRAGEASPSYAAIHFGMFIGTIQGDLKSTVTGGTFEIARGHYYFGGQGLHCPVRSITTVLGDEATGEGPTFLNKTGSATILLFGNWVRTGEAVDTNTQPADTTVSGSVVVQAAIFGGDYQADVIAGGNAGPNLTNNWRAYILGSVQTDIYGGTFTSFYGSGATPVYGHVTTNIHGGTFDAIYGARNGKVLDGVELNIFGLTEGEKPTGIWAAGTTAAISAQTEDHPDAVKLTIAPEDTLTLSMPISAGCSGAGTVTGTTSVSVSGGTYTNGFAVEGVTVKDALAEDCILANTGTYLPLILADDAISSGTGSVTVLKTVLSDALAFSSASISLYHNLGVNFKADSSLFTAGNFTEPYAVFRFGDAQTVNSSYVVGGGKASFRFVDIAPHRLGETITATLYAVKDGVLYRSEAKEYSVEKYCYNMLSTYNAVDYPDTAYSELRTLLVDLLNYGAAAQQYTNYNTDDLVNAQLAGNQLSWGTAADPEAVSCLDLTYRTVDAPSVTWMAGGLLLSDSVTVRYTLATDSLEGLTVKLEAADSEYTVDGSQLVPTGTEGQYYLYFNKLNAAQMREPILATVYVNGTAASNTVLYSIESYVAEKDGSDDALAALVKAMLRYGDSAYAFTH